MRHRDRHPVFVEGCYACKLGTIRLMPSGTATRGDGANVVRQNAYDRTLWDNREAYGRVRRQGYSGRLMDAKHFEDRAETRIEAEVGKVIAPEHRSAFAAAHEAVRR